MKDNEFRKSIKTHIQLNSIYYEHDIEPNNPIVSRLELIILALLSLCLLIHLYSVEFLVTNKCTIVYLLLFSLSVVIFFVKRVFWGVKKESIFLIKSLGLQVTVKYYSNFESSQFIPWQLIDDIVINEAILMQRVVHYLAVLIKPEKESSSYQEKSIFPLFLHTKPRLAALKDIYSKIQGILQN